MTFELFGPPNAAGAKDYNRIEYIDIVVGVEIKIEIDIGTSTEE